MTVIDTVLNRIYRPRSKPADVIKKEKELIDFLEKLGKKYKISDSLVITVELRHHYIGIFYENKEQELCLKWVAITSKRKHKLIWMWSKKSLSDSKDSDRFFKKNDMNKIKEEAEKLIMKEILKKF